MVELTLNIPEETLEEEFEGINDEAIKRLEEALKGYGETLLEIATKIAKHADHDTITLADMKFAVEI